MPIFKLHVNQRTSLEADQWISLSSVIIKNLITLDR